MKHVEEDMKKEVFLAVLVGFGLGLLITFGIWTANRNLKSISPATNDPETTPVITPIPTIDPQAKPSGNSVVPLEITSPAQDELLVNTSAFTLTGKTGPGNSVSVAFENGQKILTADETGVFSLDLKLEGGYNRINLVAYDANGNSATKEIMITYSTQKI